MITARKTYFMLGKESLWETAAQCERLLNEAQIAHSVCGGVAVCLHGYQRNTVDLDLIVQTEDSERVRETFAAAGLHWVEKTHEFKTDAGIAIQFLLAGDRAGKGHEVKIPVPVGEDNVEVIEGLTVVRLSRLIEMKLACGESNLRRTHKDYADVVELIAIRKLDASFAGLLHTSVRKTFKELLKNATSE